MSAPAPQQVAQVIFRTLFETGPKRLNATDAYVAVGSISAALIEWKKQLDAGRAGEVADWKKRYEDAKAECDDARLKLAVLQKGL